MLLAPHSVLSVYRAPRALGLRICLFAKFRRITSEVSATVVRSRRRETPRSRNFVDATPRRARVIYLYIYAASALLGDLSLRRLTRPTRRIAFLSDRADTGADSFRSIFYRYFEIQGAAAFFPKFDSHGLNSHFEILMRARQDTLLVRVIGADVVVFILRLDSCSSRIIKAARYFITYSLFPAFFNLTRNLTAMLNS